MKKIRKLAVIIFGSVMLCSCGGSELVYDLGTGSLSSAADSRDMDRTEASEEEKRGSGKRHPAETSSTEQKAEDGASPSGPGKGIPASGGIYVYVCGAVERPGVYQLPSGSRVFQALEAAGGTTEDADDKALNRAQLLSDGDQIIVYTGEEVQAGQTALPATAGRTAGQQGTAGNGPAGSEYGQKVNINSAGSEELQTLPGIGEAKAEAIIRYREEHGGFSGIEEIQKISGIKQKAFEKIKDYIEV
uniref:helix-hairpin-helix domain-containing protein n=1 Tax=Eubacterium cellulosolvens TaxID=29322 RepID=UPI000688DDDC|nr:helix-hairpin-helix domain-containing protein [[Eubacterium] cellulosolvens]